MCDEEMLSTSIRVAWTEADSRTCKEVALVESSLAMRYNQLRLLKLDRSLAGLKTAANRYDVRK